MKYAVRKGDKFNTLLNEGNSYIQKIEEKIKDELNNFCVECGEENPEFISINNGIFLCRDCVQIHLKFPKNISKIKKNNIKSLTLNEIQYLLCGGNRSLLNFICNEYPKLAELPANILYRTQAMVYYRQNLQYSINGCIPPIKPSLKSAYKIHNFFDNISEKYNDIDNINNENEIYNNTISDTGNLNENKYLFYKTGYNFRKGRKNYNNDINNLSITNTIGNNAMNYDNYFINRPKQVNFQNNNNIIIGNQLEYINNIDNNNTQQYKRFSESFNDKINIDNNNTLQYKRFSESFNDKINIDNNNKYKNNKNIDVSNINNDVYIRPKLILSHNVSKHYLVNSNTLNKKSNNSFDRNNKKYYYSQVSNISQEPKIDIIQLNFSKNIRNNNWKKRKMNKNLSLEIFKNTLNKKNNKYIHKSFSQKNFKTNNNNKNKYTINIQTENNHYIPSKQTIINYNKNNICITNNEEFQIIPNKKTKEISKIININIKDNKNNNEKNLTEQNTSNIEFNPMPIKINIKMNKKEKDNDENKEKIIKEIRKESNYSLSKTKFELKKNENIKNFILKCNKNRILLRQKEIKKTIVNVNREKDKDKEKDKEINNDKIYNNIKIKKRIYKNTSQEDVMKQPNKNIQTKKNQKIEKSDKKISKRNRYKFKYKNK